MDWISNGWKFCCWILYGNLLYKFSFAKCKKGTREMNDKEKTKQFVIKDSITVEGITENFVWYHSKLLKEKMQSWQTEFEKIVKVMENRHGEHLEMIRESFEKNHVLKRKVQELEEKCTELRKAQEK